MKKTTYTVTRFDIKDKFYVEVSPIIINGNEMYEFHICNEDCAIKELMFGVYQNDCPENTWEEMIESNVDWHVEAYIENYIS